MQRLEIHRKIQGLPRNSAPNRVRNRCWATGKPRGGIEIWSMQKSVKTKSS